MWGLGIIKSVVDGVKEYTLESKKQKTLKIERDTELALLEYSVKVEQAKAKVELAKQGLTQDYDLDKLTTENMRNSYKDEFVLLILYTPVVLCFTKYSDEVLQGFEVLKQTPDWFMYLVVGATIVTLGMRGLLTQFLNGLGNKIKFKKD